MPPGLEGGACAGLSKADPVATARPAHPPSVSLDMLDMSAVENSCCGAPLNELSALLSTDPFELMTSARTAAAPDCCELELPESAVRLAVAPEPGP
jgi:hypothetical protein